MGKERKLTSLFDTESTPDIIAYAHAVGVSLGNDTDRLALSLMLVDQQTGVATKDLLHVVISSERAVEIATMIMQVAERNGWELPDDDPMVFLHDGDKAN